jgi:TPR repeat protein
MNSTFDPNSMDPADLYQVAIRAMTGFGPDRVKALEHMKLCAEKGYPEAQYQMGYRFENGLNQDELKAIHWYERASKQGVVSAQIRLAAIYEKNNDMKKAGTWYLQAAKKGNAEAQKKIAAMCESGINTQKNIQKAIFWYQQAAEQNDVESQYTLGLIYENGEGVEIDEKTAIHWYQRAAKNEDPDAQYRLGYLYQYGQQTERNMDEALEWYHKAATNHHVDAQFRLGIIYDYGTDAKKDEKKAAEFYQMAALQKHLVAQSHLGLMYKDGRGVEKDEKKAHFLFQCVTQRIQTETGEISLAEIKKKMDPARSYIPEVWPLPIDQRGPSCGFYALFIAALYGFGDTIPIFPPRKDGDAKKTSFRQVAKENNLTIMGELFNIYSLEFLAQSSNIPDCKVINDKDIGLEAYTKTICEQLQKNSLIVACNINSSFFPSAKGNPHLAVVYGYYFSKQENKYKFLVTQCGKYYEWDAEKLYKSNDNIPAGNNLRKMDISSLLLKEKWRKRWAKEQERIKDIPDKELTPCILRYGIFRVPKIDSISKKPASLTGVTPSAA